MNSDATPPGGNKHGHSGTTATTSMAAADVYRQMIDLASDIVYRTDANGRFTFYNHAARTVLRYDSQELVGRYYLRLVHPDHRSIVRAHYEQQRRLLTPATYLEFLALDCDGGSCWLGQHVQLLVENGRVTGFQAIARDITKQKKLEADLAEREVRLEALFDDAPIAYHEIDDRGIITRVNRAECRLLGYESYELIGRPVWTLVSPDQQPASREAVLGKLSGAVPLAPFQRQYLRSDRTAVILEIHENLIQSGQAIVGIRSALLDVTERVRTEQQRCHTEALLREAQALTHIGSWDYDVATGRTTWSDELFRIFERDSALGAPTLDDYYALVHEDDRESFKAVVTQSLALGADYEVSHRILVPSGVPKHVLARGHATRDLGGVVTKLTGTAEDVTYRVQMECEIRQARDAALAATEAKGRFLAMMSHEIRTRMTGIVGLSNLLLDTPLSKEQDEFARTIHSASESLIAILNDILDYSKLEAGKIDLDVITFSPRTIVAETVSLFRESARGKGIELRSLVEKDVPDFLCGDGGRVRQVLLNLVSNAIKFTKHGEVLLSLRLLERTPSQAQVRFEVRDTGIGMTPEVMQKLFQPFSQAEASTSRQYGGTGLGLSIAKLLIRLLGGDLSVSSKPGEGSTFSCTLTMATPEPSAGPTTPHTSLLLELLGAIQESARSGERILVAEDNAVNQKLVSHLLSKRGYEVTIVSNGAEVLQIVDEQSFDLILMDCEMPVMDGYTACARLREKGCTLPIIAMTAHAMAGDREKCLRSGMSDYISKPIDVARLTATLATCLAPRSLSSVSRPQ